MARILFVSIPLFILVGILGWLVLVACGVRFSGPIPILNFCTPNESVTESDLSGLEAEQRSLRNRLRQLERDLANRQCDVIEQAELAPEIDEELWRQQDVSALEGCWTLDGEVYTVVDELTDAPTSFHNWDMCFDASGAGQQRLSSNDGLSCEGDVVATFDDSGELRVLDQGDVQCSGNGRSFRIFERLLRCTLDDAGDANCVSRQPSRNSGGGTNVRLKRKEG